MPIHELPPPRRKSCVHCIKAKRRCDLRRPYCGRCNSKKLNCDYGDAQSRQASVEINSSRPEESQSFASSSRQTSAAPRDEDTGLPFELTLNSNLANDNQYIYWQPNIDSFPTAWSTSPAGPSGYVSYTPQSIINFPKTDLSYDSSTTPSSRVLFSVAWLRKIPVDFSRTTNAPFLHPALYNHSMPTSMINAFTACALYSNKTPENHVLVVSIIDRYIADLIANSHIRVDPHENLARVQALLLYQIIRAFDGDTTMRNQAEAAMKVLETCAKSLKRIRDTSEELQITSYGSGVNLQAPQSWEIWIFHESVRRTLVMTYYFITIFDIIKQFETGVDIDQLLLQRLAPSSEDLSSHWSAAHPWTLSRHLWNSQSSTEFFVNWRDRPHFTVTNLCLEPFRRYGAAEDVCEFGQLFLNTFMGPHHAESYFSRTMIQY